MSATVEPRKVLQLINSMGYRNISASELKAFTKDVKKLMKYEQQQKNHLKEVAEVRHAPENIINVTIVKESSPIKCDHRPTVIEAKPVQKANVQQQTDAQSESGSEPKDSDEREKQSKNMLRLSRHIKSRNPNIIYKKGIVSGVRSGVLVRNTPTDLYKKYQEDWQKYKSYIPGENDRVKVRRSVRQKMQLKEEDNAKVYIHFPDETGDH